MQLSSRMRAWYGAGMRSRRKYHAMAASVGLPLLRIHDLRHRYASFLVNSGRSLYEVQQILGHSDP
jgi:site-specific recombinase XerD